MKNKILLVSLIFAVVCGCEKKESVNTAKHVSENAKEEMNEANCPPAYRLDYEDVLWCYSDKKYDTEAFKDIVCRDGKLYCYGQDNEPMLRPENPEGWTCQFVVSMPEDDKYKQQYMFLDEYFYHWTVDDNFHRVERIYDQWAFMKAWVCSNKESGCLCGGKQCPFNGSCIDETCYCNDELYMGGECSLREPKPHPKLYGYLYKFNEPYYISDVDENERYKYDADVKGKIIGDVILPGYMLKKKYGYTGTGLVYYTSRKSKLGDEGNVIDEENVIDGEYDFYCNDIKIENSKIQHCITLADGRIALHLENFNRFWDGDDKKVSLDCAYDNGDIIANCLSEVSVAVEIEKNRQKIYRCGNEICDPGQTCLENHCVFLRDVNNNSSIRYNILYAHLNHYNVSRYHKSLEYDYEYKPEEYEEMLLENEDYIEEEDEDVMSEDDVEVWDDDYSIFFDIYTRKSAAACDNFPIPADLDDYVCVFTVYEDGCAEAGQSYFSAAGFHCANPDGCMCGNSKIPLYAACIDGKVSFDDVYQTQACNREMLYWEITDTPLIEQMSDERGWCRCGKSTVPPYMKGYYCDSSAMICKYKSGCQCGSAVCQFNEACVELGKCE